VEEEKDAKGRGMETKKMEQGKGGRLSGEGDTFRSPEGPAELM